MYKKKGGTVGKDLQNLSVYTSPIMTDIVPVAVVHEARACHQMNV